MNRTSANDLYDIYLVPQLFHKYKNGFKLTEGVYDIVNYESCTWLIDKILEQQYSFDFKIEIWVLSRVDNDEFTLTGKNKLGFEFIVLENLISDFYFDDLTIIKKDKIFCLPIEESLY